MNLPETGLLLLPGGVQRYRLIFEPLGPVETHLAAVAANATNIHPNVGLLYDRPVGIAMSRTNTRLWVNLPQLRIDTFWTINGENRYSPTFKAVPGALSKDLMWTPPAGVKLFFVTAFGTGAQPNDATYMAATIDGHNGTFRVPLPNVFADGKLCLGSATRVDGAAPLLVQFKSLVDQFFAGSWNGDLLNETPDAPVAHALLFSYSLDDTPVQKPAPKRKDAWLPYWKKISNAYTEDLPLVAK